jgi:hypothetical protein
MKMLPITSQHLLIAQKIVSFVQEQGWDITGLEITRYNERNHPLLGEDEGESWKGAKMKWHLHISTAPRDNEEVVPVTERVG